MKRIKRLEKTNKESYYDSDESVAAELVMFVENDGDLYRQQTTPIMKNLMKKWKKGTYDHSLAPKMWGYLMDSAAKKYVQEFGSPDDKWHEMFPKNIRMLAAQMMADRWKEEAELGNYDYLLD